MSSPQPSRQEPAPPPARGVTARGAARPLRERLAALIAPEAYSPEERAYLARHLTVTLRLALPALLVGGIVSAVAGFRITPFVFAAMLPLWLALRLTRGGKLSEASAVLVTSLLLFATWVLYRGEGLQDIAMILYPVIVLVAGLLMPRRPFALLVGMALLSLAFVAWGQARGLVHLLDPRLRPYLGAYFLIAVVVISVAAAMVHLLAEDLRKSLRQARRSEERYRLISEVSTDYVFSSAVGRDGQVRQNWVAGAFERMTGYSFEEFMAHGGWRAALHPDDVAQDDRDLETLRGNRPVITELRTLTRGGEQRWVRVYGHPVWDPAENRLAGIYGAVQDITEAKRAEAEREALIRELEAKNAELERFTYTVSHDLKSPLVTIRGFLGFVERDALAGHHERLQIDLRRIDEATDRMATLLDELLELSRVGRVVNPPEAIPFGELAADAAALLAGPIAERGVSIRIEEGLPTVWGDRTRLLQVVQNLLENAVKFSGDQPQPRVEIGARAGSPPLLYVRDNGVGVEASQHERIFGLFDKLDAKSPGAGVGLALVRRIVELHGGRVWVESDGPGGGSTFFLNLPAPPVPPGPS